MRLLAIIGAGAVFVAATASAAEPAQTPDPARLKLAHELLVSSGDAEQMRSLLKESFDGAQKALTANLDPKLRAAVAVAGARNEERLLDLVQSVRDVSETIYAETLTETELKDAIAWNQSASGRSVRAKTPDILRKVIAAEAPMMRRFMIESARDNVRSACAASGCSSEELAAALAKVDAMFGQARS